VRDTFSPSRRWNSAALNQKKRNRHRRLRWPAHLRRSATTPGKDLPEY
jgi:hypothetical protein